MTARILVVHWDLHYINRTARLWPLLFRECGDVTLFGPGFVTETTLDEGLTRFVRDHGPFDVVVASEHAFYNTLSELDPPDQVQVYRRNYNPRFDVAAAIARSPSLLDELRSVGVPTLLAHFETDTYNLMASHDALLRDWSDAYVVGWGADFIRPVAELPELRRESFAGRAQDRWHDLVTDQAARVVSMPAFVSPDEFSFTPLAGRRSDWAVPGSGYWARKEARRVLEDAGIGWNGRRLYYAMAGLERVWRRAMGLRPVVWTANEWFRRAIVGARFGYTCGSALDHPIRKFFEIPALGAVLVCRPFTGFERAGFVHGVSAIACEPGAILDAHRSLTSDPPRAQAIARAGQGVVWRSHSLMARGRQMGACLEAILGGRFRGTRWVEGSFEVIEATEDLPGSHTRPR